MNEDILLQRKLTDTANKSYRQNIYTYTSFLSISELDTYYRMLPELSFIHSETFGGSPSCERQIVRFGSEQDFGFEEAYPIDCIKISPLITKFADKLSHRDFLGAVLNLGIERNLIGDIIIRDNIGYMFCISHISSFIIDNLEKIKHTNIKCELSTLDNTDFAPILENIEIICASPRIDAVVASITKLSRSKAVELFRTQKVFINGKCMENNSYALKPNDILVIRSFGKYIYQGSGNETRKGRVYIKLQKYV